MQKSPLSPLIAQALIDARVSVCTHVPGYGGTETFRDYQKLVRRKVPYSFHEEVAYTITHAAGLVGARSACLIKTHGVAKAINSVLSSLSAGTRGGMVVFAFDDKQGSHSDNILNADALIRGTEMPFERIDLKDPYEHIHRAFERSESLGLPTCLIVDTAIIGREIPYQRRELTWQPPVFRSQPDANVVCPPRAPYQRAVLETKLSGDRNLSRIPGPAPLEVPQGLPSPLKEAASTYVPIFEAFRSAVRNSSESAPIVCGDAGTSSLFAFSPYHCIDFCTYMGGSTSLALGAALAGRATPWAITGDFSFISAGHLGLVEALHRGVALKLLILDNKKASATGNQEIESGLLDAVLQPYAAHVTLVDASDSQQRIQETLSRANRSASMSIVVATIR